MLALAFASLRLHRRRYAAATVAILLGVAFSTLTFTVINAATRGLGDALVQQYSAADVVVTTPSGRIPPALAAQVAALGQVGSSTVSHSDTYAAHWPGTTATSYVGISEIPNAADLRWQPLAAGRFPARPDEVALSSSTASSEAVTIGDVFRLSGLGRGGLGHRVTVVGLVDTEPGITVSSAVFTPDGVLAAWSARTAGGELVATATAGVSPDQLRAAIDTLDGPGLAQTTDQLRRQATSSLTDDIDLLGLFFQAFAAIALLVAGLVIANTFTIVLAQRTRDLALMRCVGAERRQVLRTVVLEALALGVVAAFAGVATGLGLGALLVLALDRSSLPVAFRLTAPTPGSVVVPSVVGVVITLLAAVAPARRATMVAPLEALRPATLVAASTTGRVRLCLGLLMLLVGALGLLLATVSGSLLVGVAGGCVSILGVLALGPVVIPGLIRGLGSVRRVLPRRLRGGVPAGMAVANAVRNPRRTAATASALLIGVTLISTLTVGASSVSASSSAAINHNNPIDVTVTEGGPGGGAGHATGGLVTARLANEVRSGDGISGVVLLAGRTVKVGRTVVTVATADDDAQGVLRDPQLASTLRAGNRAVVPYSYGGSIRPRITITSGKRSVTLSVTYSAIASGPILIPAPALAALGGADRPVGLWVEASGDADPQSVMDDVQRAVGSVPGGDSLVVSGGYLDRAAIDHALNIMLLVATGLLATAVLIALIGVSNTLSLSVVERTREQGLLRALGLTKGQLRAMLASEAILMAFVAAALGVSLGIVFGWAGTVTLIGNVTEQSPVLDVPWTRLGLVVTVALVAGLLASVLPGRRAARLSPANALAEG